MATIKYHNNTRIGIKIVQWKRENMKWVIERMNKCQKRAKKERTGKNKRQKMLEAWKYAQKGSSYVKGHNDL